MKRSPCELGVIQRQQRFKIADYLGREPPLSRLMSVREGGLDRVFGDLEPLHRLVAMTSTLPGIVMLAIEQAKAKWHSLDDRLRFADRC